MKECNCQVDCKFKGLLRAIAGVPNIEAIAMLMPEYSQCRDPQTAINEAIGVDGDKIDQMLEASGQRPTLLGS